MTPPPPSSTVTNGAAAASADTLRSATDVQLRALESLRADGIAVLRFEELLGEDLWREARADMDAFVAETEATLDVGDVPEGKDDIIVRRFFERAPAGGGEKRRPSFGLDSPWLRAAASVQLLDLINAYTGEPTKIFYLDNWFTVPYANAEERISSQRWHRDGDDEHVVKVFTYFSDVDDDSGPFEFVKGSPDGLRHGDVWPWQKKHDLRYPPAGELEATLPAEDFVSLTGPPGTVIVCDTGGFHRGGFARTKPRVMSIASYVAATRMRGERRFTVDFDGREGALPPQVQFALT